MAAASAAFERPPLEVAELGAAVVVLAAWVVACVVAACTGVVAVVAVVVADAGSGRVPAVAGVEPVVAIELASACAAGKRASASSTQVPASVHASRRARRRFRDSAMPLPMLIAACAAQWQIIERCQRVAQHRLRWLRGVDYADPLWLCPGEILIGRCDR